MIVQLPLPKQISEERIKLAVDPKKDIDGFHPLGSFDPCTPKGIVDYLSAEGFNFKGKNAVVLGRSNIVGKPMAKMLLKKDCNVTVLHSKTSEEDKKFYLAHADLIVVAIGRLGYLDGRFQYKKDAIIVDVGINRGEDGKLQGVFETFNINYVGSNTISSALAMDKAFCKIILDKYKIKQIPYVIVNKKSKIKVVEITINI